MQTLHPSRRRIAYKIGRRSGKVKLARSGLSIRSLSRELEYAGPTLSVLNHLSVPRPLSLLLDHASLRQM